MNKDDVKFLSTYSNKKEVKFLAPLDNLIWDRAMTSEIFDFEYRWEVYTPVPKRKYGYYVLPVLYGNKFIARFEPEKIKKGRPLTIKNWWWENGIDIKDELLEEIHLAIERFADYLDVPCYDNYLDIIMKNFKDIK